MKFSLVYTGELKSNGGKRDKHRLRRHFHLQLKKYWNQYPLKDYESVWNPGHKLFKEDLYIVNTVQGIDFVPLINSKLYLTASLDIELLMPDPPGSFRLHAGDIDNKLKTLLDALRIPRVKIEIPKNYRPQVDERPMFCLLEDDSLITDISVHTRRWLEPDVSPLDVMLIINVTTAVTRLTAYNSELGGNIV